MSGKFTALTVCLLFVLCFSDARAEKSVVILREIPASDLSQNDRARKLQTLVWDTLKEALIQFNLKVFELGAAQEAFGGGLGEYIQAFNASHVITPNFVAIGDVPTFRVRVLEWETKQEFHLPVSLFAEMRRDPVPILQATGQRIAEYVVDQDVTETIFAGCFRTAGPTQLASYRIHRIPLKLRTALRKTDLKDEYQIQSFASIQIAEEHCEGNLAPEQAELLDYYGSTDVQVVQLLDYKLSGQISEQDIWVDIQRHHKSWRQLERKIKRANEFESELARQIARCWKVETHDCAEGVER